MSRQLLSILMSSIVLTSTLSAGPPILAAAQPVTVTVDGNLVVFDQPPVMVGGRVLIPMRGVFQRLGARVEWVDSAQQVIARRGSTVVVLQPGVRSALVDGRTIVLDVPALIMGGRTLVPLRFVGQALGARVDWNDASRIVSVSSASGQALSVPPVQAPAPPPVAPQAPVAPPGPPLYVQTPPPAGPPIRQVEGTVVRVDMQSVPPRLFGRTDGNVWSTTLTSATAIFMTEVTTGRGGSVGLDQIRRGDFVRVTEYPPGQATEIRASYRELAGRLDGWATRALYLTSGQALRLAEEPLFILDGQVVNRDLLRQGMDVTMRLNPQTNEVWEVRVLTAVVPPPVRPGFPRIDRVSLNTTGPLGVGATLVVTMHGTPDGRAWFDITRLVDGIRMEEGPDGRYVGRYTVRSGEVAKRADVIVRLRARGAEATRAVDGVMVDGLSPEFTRRAPEPNSTVRTSRPSIIVGFADRGPAGIQPGSLHVWVNGEEARMTAVSERAASFDPPAPLSSGRVKVLARIADAAGNEASTSWTFNVEFAGPTPFPPDIRPTPVPTTAPVGPPPGGIRPTPLPPDIRPTPLPTTAPVVPIPPGGVRPSPTPVAVPVITEPKPGYPVRSPLVIRGTGLAGHQVQVTVEYQFQGQTAVASIGPMTTMVTGSGTWEVRVPLPSPIAEAGRITITAVAVAPGGGRSDPARIVLTWSEREFGRP